MFFQLLVVTDCNFITGMYVRKGRLLLGAKSLLRTTDHSAKVNGYAKGVLSENNWVFFQLLVLTDYNSITDV